ncbi:creatininase family protein [Nibricoccus sp. IMCC34717]|uniref:creatininase family protein n=1 Tax=Nibricoccus sp. IMCC34717 TaxID=3034021 RepID=UPI00384DBA61
MKVRYEELLPHEFRSRLAAAPVAYLPLGTLEWHGEHLPLGADSLQSEEFFVLAAERLGGIVLPPLFLGPDRRRQVGDGWLIGMDQCTPEQPNRYEERQFAGSAYWSPDELFNALVEATLWNLKRAGFRVVVGHGHGPSTTHWHRSRAAWEDKFGLVLTGLVPGPADESLGYMCDHAAVNETSLVQALRPELADLTQIKDAPDVCPAGLWGDDPRGRASAELGRRVIEANLALLAQRVRTALATAGATYSS